MARPTVGFAGMTHLGVVSAAALGAKGFPIAGYDADAARIEALRAGKPPVLEPGLDELLATNRDQTFTSKVEDLCRCDVVYVSTDVPTDDAGRSDLSGIAALVERLLANLGPQAILVVLCQVPPGWTRRIALAPDRLYYQVETLVFGRAVERASKPERYIVGCADPARPLPAAFQEVLGAFDCPILPMRYESAELAKISINMCLVASVSVANTMAEVAEKIGADWSEIAPALKLDRRIGAYSYLSPGLGIAGGNLERDLATVVRLSEEHGTDSRVVQAWLANSAHRRDWALATLHRELLAAATDPLLAVWGLAYKENTASTKNSPSLHTIGHLKPYRLRAFDPAVPVEAAAHPRAEGAANPLDAARGADALLVLTAWPEFKRIAPADVARAMKGRLVLDPYAVLDARAARAAGLAYHTLGAPGC